ncbi:hypothetical protein V1288_003177 [Bradyrhizobium sp. AZCC 2176]
MVKINKGPYWWTPVQWTAGFAGFFVSAALAHVLVSQGYLTKNWGTVIIGAGLCVPVAIVGWLQAKKRRGSN